VSEAQSHEQCGECGQTFTLIALPWEPYTAESVLALLRKVCCVCDACLAQIPAEDDA
jgi:hypothetical protein